MSRRLRYGVNPSIHRQDLQARGRLRKLELMRLVRLSRVGVARARWLTVAAAAVGAFVIAAPSAFANEEVRFDFDPANPNAEHEWTVPDRVEEIEIEVAGAGGGGGSANGGNGALVKAAVQVSAGQSFDIGVGGGGEATLAQQSGGGGASIVESGDILMIAGGGGGATNWNDASGGNAGHNTSTGAGQKGGLVNKDSGGSPGGLGVGGTGRVDAGDGEDYDPSRGLFGTGGQRGQGAQVGGPGGEARDEFLGNHGEKASPALGGGGGAGYGGGSSGFDAFSWKETGTRGGGGGGGSIAQGTGVSFAEGETAFYSSDGGSGGQEQAQDGQHGWVIIRWTAPPPPEPDPEPEPEPDADPAGAESPTSSEPVPLSLAMPTGVTCTPTAPMLRGSWVRLPSAAECSESPAARAGGDSQLLGWATVADFPVDLAADHAETSEYALEMRNDDGQLTAVFIPAGGWTYVTGANTLFPIWSDGN